MNGPPPEELRFREQRRAAILASGVGQGLDFIEPVATPPDGGSSWSFKLNFVAPPSSELAREHLRVLTPGGDVDPEIQVLGVEAGPDTDEGVLVTIRVAAPSRARLLRSDPAEYRLEIRGLGLDRFFASAPFRFDGRLAGPAGSRRREPLTVAPGNIDYLAKDYESFRQLMLERLSAYVPDWTERNPADIGVAIVEVLAYAADYLSHFQDAVATEAYLHTARKRGSVRRHLRLLGHTLHEGCNARVWVHVAVRAPFELAAGTQLLTQCGELPPVLLEGSRELVAALDQGSLAFETMHAVRLLPELNRMPIHTWGAEDYSLTAGSTSLALAGHFPQLAVGDVLILEPPDSAGGRDGVGGGGRRHAARISARPRLATDPLGGAPVTEVEFDSRDALVHTVPVTLPGSDAESRELTVARGNVVLADHGRTTSEQLEPVGDSLGIEIHPAQAMTRRQPFDPEAARREAASSIGQSAVHALPELVLVEAGAQPDPAPGSEGVWSPRLDLLESLPYAAEFAVETESDGSVSLRFGDGKQGRRPQPGTRFTAVFREGNGPEGHIGPESIAHLVTRDDLPVLGVRNPLAAEGGEPPEALERARWIAPRAFRRTEQCVTPQDLVLQAERLSGVLRAAATTRWTGSWETFVLYVQRPRGIEVDARFERFLRRELEPRLLAGGDLQIRSPLLLPLEIVLRATLLPGASATTVHSAVLDAFGDPSVADGEDSADGEDGAGYFHPDRFGFGQPVLLDEIVDLTLGLPGVAAAEAECFRPWGAAPELPRVSPTIAPREHEIVCVRNRPAAPELGSLRVLLEGGA